MKAAMSGKDCGQLPDTEAVGGMVVYKGSFMPLRYTSLQVFIVMMGKSIGRNVQLLLL